MIREGGNLNNLISVFVSYETLFFRIMASTLTIFFGTIELKLAFPVKETSLQIGLAKSSIKAGVVKESKGVTQKVGTADKSRRS